MSISIFIKRLMVIILISASVNAGAQNRLYYQGFEGDPCENWTYTGGIATAGVQRTGNHSGRIGYLSNSLLFSPANVSGYSGLLLNIYHSVKPGPGPGIDTREGAVILVSINGGAFIKIASVGGYNDASWPFSSSYGGSNSGSAGCSIFTTPNPVVFNIPNGTASVQVKVVSVRAGTCGAFNTAISNATPNLYDRADEGFYIDDVQITTTNPLPQVVLTSAPGTDAQHISACMPVPITTIQYTTGYGVIDVTGLPAGVSYTYAAGLVTISGSPASDGIFNYTVTNICTDSSASGTITKTTPLPLTQTTSLSGCNHVLFNGTNYTASIVLNDTLQSYLGCDSIYIVTNIVITPITALTQTTSLSGCNNVLFNGTNYTSSIVLNDTLRSYQGCDSIYKVTNIVVTTITPLTQTINVSGCNNVLFNGTNYTSSILLNDTLRSYQGCDSIYKVTNIVVTPITALIQTTNLSGCNHVLFNGTNYTSSIVLNDTLRSYQGCDSIYKLINIVITTITPLTQATNVSACNNVLYNGTNYSSSIILNDTLRSYQGCDSIYKITNIVITPIAPLTQTTNLSGCNNVMFNGTNYTSSIVLNDTLRSYQGCDSIYNVTNIVITSITPTTQTTNIIGCDHVLFNGTNYTSSIVLNDTLRSYQGCDSIYKVTNIIVTPITALIQTTNLSGCNNVLFNGTNYTSSIVLNDTLTSYQGCDSIYKLTNIVVTPITPLTQTTNLSGCNHVVLNGINYTSSIVLNDTLRSYQGCDSIYKITNIVITPITALTQTTNLSGCNNVLFNGTNYTSSIVLNDTLKSYQGCDSIYKLTNIIVTLITPATQTINLSGCDHVLFNGTNYTSSIVLNDTLRSYQGCDSIYKVINITITPITAVTQDTSIQGCGSVIVNGISYTYSTQITSTIKSTSGCDSIYKRVNIIVLPNDFSLRLTSSVNNINPGLPVTVSTIATGNYQVLSWQPANVFTVQSATTQYFYADTSMHIRVTAKSAGGCIGDASLLLTVHQLQDDIYFPTAFNPHSTVGNRAFGPLGRLSLIKNYSLIIYNRWGQMVFSSADPFQRWDGTVKGAFANPGNFVWQASYLYKGLQKRTTKGNVVLIQ